MSTTSTRLGMILPDDGGPNGDDIINVTTQISNNFQTLENSLAYFHVANQAALPSSGNFKGRLCWADDTNTIWRYDGSGWVVFQDVDWQTASAVIKASGTPITLGTGGYYSNWYRRFGKVYEIKYQMVVGSSGFGGGLGAWATELPSVPANMGGVGVEYPFELKLHVPNAGTAGYKGYAWAVSGSAALSMASQTDIIGTVGMYSVQNTDGGGAAGTGIPRVAGNYTWTTAGNVHITGKYLSV